MFAKWFDKRQDEVWNIDLAMKKSQRLLIKKTSRDFKFCRMSKPATLLLFLLLILTTPPATGQVFVYSNINEDTAQYYISMIMNTDLSNLFEIWDVDSVRVGAYQFFHQDTTIIVSIYARLPAVWSPRQLRYKVRAEIRLAYSQPSSILRLNELKDKYLYLDKYIPEFEAHKGVDYFIGATGTDEVQCVGASFALCPQVNEYLNYNFFCQDIMELRTARRNLIDSIGLFVPNLLRVRQYQEFVEKLGINEIRIVASEPNQQNLKTYSIEVFHECADIGEMCSWKLYGDSTYIIRFRLRDIHDWEYYPEYGFAKGIINEIMIDSSYATYQLVSIDYEYRQGSPFISGYIVSKKEKKRKGISVHAKPDGTYRIFEILTWDHW